MKLTGSYKINLEKQKVWEALIDPVILLLTSSNIGPGVPIIFPDESYHVIIKSVLAPEVKENKISSIESPSQ